MAPLGTAQLAHALGQYGRSGEQKGRLEFGSTGSGFVNLVLHSRISPHDPRIGEALLCHFSSTIWVVTVNLLTRGDKKCLFGAV
jgi:hypothetical protein